MNVGIIGTGYVGLVTGAVLSDIGHVVTCLDINEEKINTLKKGQSPIYEPGLDEILARNIAASRLCFTTNAQEAFAQADIIFISVGTPQGEDGAADLSYIEQAAKDIAINVDHDVIVVVKSTVPVGTNDRVEEILHANMLAGLQIHVVSNPEFLREGHAINDTFYGDRIVIGAENPIARDKIESLFQSLNIPILHTNRRSAEMIKYASNAFLAVKISYINQISNLCNALGADVNAVADGMGMDHRIGRAFLNAGLGYGGSCFPKDTEALTYLASENDVNLSIVQSAIQANSEQRHIFVQKVINHFKGEVVGKKIAILGLAFKPNTDDMREAPSIMIIKELVAKGAEISAYDPVVKKSSYLEGIELTYAATKEECVSESDAILLVTEWQEFIEADWAKLMTYSSNAIVFDGRQILKI
ncbi:UDP-glucose 6-dehydrogenase [Lysinibacillus sp. KCTC 33748]|uniref:UDP-glucose dehydrogenase family protein n=1 Tax=unclassified Lysinibacillus TaxID=2636778 RepID=UPI0009A644E3|nr:MULTISPECIES: UDP-glucose/GDP-mannose dehydrogenase family protein [unclassified Lysinibacillus]OXS77030.1 UDP-glucose 6-dehydrogenase [Lysinibacillus sp. KCTC 33748]SKB29030.1 UDPglucose 6-dehydrogenase [Lysinibacillus sp. AC-3]